MEPKQVEYLLKEWEEVMHDLEIALSEMIPFLKGNCDRKNFVAINAMAIEYTNLVAEKVGDSGEWLEYFWCDCELGRKPMIVTFYDGESILLDSVEALVEIILAQ